MNSFSVKEITIANPAKTMVVIEIDAIIISESNAVLISTGVNNLKNVNTPINVITNGIIKSYDLIILPIPKFHIRFRKLLIFYSTNQLCFSIVVVKF